MSSELEGLVVSYKGPKKNNTLPLPASQHTGCEDTARRQTQKATTQKLVLQVQWP